MMKVKGVVAGPGRIARSAQRLTRIPLRLGESAWRGVGPAAMMRAARGRSVRLALGYVVLSGLWIVGSDRLLDAIGAETLGGIPLQTLKGWTFVLATGALLYALTRSEDRRWIAAQADVHRTKETLRTFITSTPLAIVGLDVDGVVQLWNPAAERMFGWTEAEVLGVRLPNIPEDRRTDFDRNLATIHRGEGITDRKARRVRKDGSPIEVAFWAAPLRGENDAVIGTVIAYSDLSDWNRAQREIRRQIERLQALRSIDRAITASHDIQLTLSVLIDQVASRLGVPAASVLLYDPATNLLETATSHGLPDGAMRERSIRLGEGLAGRAALERSTLPLSDWGEDRGEGDADPRVPPGGWTEYWVAPLIAKGELLGVLEVFSPDPVDATSDWTAFLEALAGQAAIAVDNARLFTELQRSNAHLRIAYNATLEGWSRALDLRDKETEGHSRRVTEMTVRLARALGLEGDELQNVRRGALLHDIGKMGIPDAILLKPGPLTDEEWEIMRRHPDYAYELLSPISFLRPALDIPYAHHEKWDGTGYPRGLAGEQIPLAARIFAVVDVWDALRSDRPYRASWPDDEIRAFIAGQASTHFDPAVVERFLALDWGERPPAGWPGT